ncbi:ParB N-terminal domain-containing protein [Fimbriiglobus ruber]|uniref:DNA modification methylase n=1 Tax=Fimbriiglobus ruber TaxID=1908690 RepID=A0A225DRV7_9BACT|nr:ParB N-terminal domain-containing protein [Fimbriiglobus ruber]OWK39879.1 DNA modification methylase [Fimbriiglobus ruber]
MDVQMRPLGSITPYPGNPRDNAAAVDAVAASIREFGFRQPIVVDAHDVIVVGHTRYQAAVRLGCPSPRSRGRPDPAQAKAYRLADNQTATLATWDETLLPKELADLQALDFDLALTGFSADDLARLLADPPANPRPTPTMSPNRRPSPSPGRRRVGPGPPPPRLRGQHRSRRHRERAQRTAADLLLTDPPYNVVTRARRPTG